MKNIIYKISSELKSKFYFDYETKNNVWFRSGGKAAVFCLVYDEKELEYIIKNILNIPYEIIGAGSNMLIRDRGFEGIIFKLGKNFNKIEVTDSFLEVGASILDINLSRFAKLKNIKDFEFFSGIPGTIGGAVKMNAGCYGLETKDNLKEIKIINSLGKIINLKKEQINLTYRNSSLNKGDLVLSAYFNYLYGEPEEIALKLNEIKERREISQPLKTKTSGSTFKNPPNHFAAKLIEMAGCKNLNVGDVFVSTKHSNFLINTNNATANDIEELGLKIIERVYNKFNIKLEWEVRIIGNH